MSLAQKFADEMLIRKIDKCENLEELKELTKVLLKTYLKQKKFLEEEMKRSLRISE